MLAAAIAQGNPAEAATARQVLTSKVPFTLKDDDWMPYSPDKALELIAWLAIDPDGPEATATLDRMLNERNPYGHWRTTWANGWSLIAMGLYAENEESRGESVAINLETNDGARSHPTHSRFAHRHPHLPLGPNLKLNVTADHSAFVRARVASKPPVAPIQPVANNGLSIDRLYYRVNPDGSAEPLTEPKPGDLDPRFTARHPAQGRHPLPRHRRPASLRIRNRQHRLQIPKHRPRRPHQRERLERQPLRTPQ